MKILVAISDPGLIHNVFDDATLADLTALGELDWAPRDGRFTQASFEACIADYDICITSWGSPTFTDTACARATRLKFIGHAAGTLAPYLVPDIFTRDIVIVNASEQLALSTAECAFALMMTGAWNLHAYDIGMRAGRWSQSRRETVMGVHGQTIGLVGLGQVSRQLIRYLQPLQATVLVHSQHLAADEARALGVHVVALDELLARSAIVSLHGTLTARTRGMIGARELASMRDGSLLVNTARAELVDGSALLTELRSGRLRAALDVFEREPLDRDDPLLQWPNVTCSPHIGGISAHWRHGIGRNIVHALTDFLAGKALPQRITAERFQAMSAH